MSAYGGAGAHYGGAGSIYLQSRNTQPAIARFVVDNNGNLGTNTLLGSPSPNADLYIKNGAVLSVSSSAFIGNLTVESNSWIETTGSQNFPRIINVAGDAMIEAGGGIRAGRINIPGMWAGGFSSAAGGGGGNGGYGSDGGAPAARGGVSHGSTVSPQDPGGRGGGAGLSDIGGPGAGAVRIDVKGLLKLDGTITADGYSGPRLNSGGGAGGSIWLTVGKLTGAGSITANGAPGQLPFGGGGGGGRIAIYYKTNEFTGSVSAVGGNGPIYAGAGTIYWRDQLKPFGQVLVDNKGSLGTNSTVSSSEPFDLTLAGGAIVNLLDPALVVHSLLMRDGSGMTHLDYQSNLDVTVLGDALVDANSAISVDGKGYRTGPGAGKFTVDGGGGGYGGAGGQSVSGAAGGSTYGSAEEPVDRGSGGGVGLTNVASSQGGGAVHLKVGGTLHLDGALTANGNDGTWEGAGGGSGGSIWLTTRKLEGAGSISADGGMGEPFQGGGGGAGRIAVYSSTNVFTGTATAFGGEGAVNGGIGSLLLFPNLPSLQIIDQYPTGVVTYPVDFVSLTFDAPIDPGSLSNALIQFQTPNGLVTASNLVGYLSSPTKLTASFFTLTTPGDYKLTVLPRITNFYGVPMSQTYTGAFSIRSPIISGTITSNKGTPISHVTVQPSGSLPPADTDSSGSFSLPVLPGWTGTISASKPGWISKPLSLQYYNVSFDQAYADFVLLPVSDFKMNSRVVGRNLELSWTGLDSEVYLLLTSTNLVDWYPYDGTQLTGTNGPIVLTVPFDEKEMRFFRFSAN
jgi:hypothetical protein